VEPGNRVLKIQLFPV